MDRIDGKELFTLGEDKDMSGVEGQNGNLMGAKAELRGG